MKAIIFLTIFFLWSCENKTSNNVPDDNEDNNLISSIDTVVEKTSAKVEEKEIIESVVSNKISFEGRKQVILSDENDKLVYNWWMAEKSKRTILEWDPIFSSGGYKFNVYGSVDSQGIGERNAELGKKRALAIIKKLKAMVPESDRFPNNFNVVINEKIDTGKANLPTDVNTYTMELIVDK